MVTVRLASRCQALWSVAGRGDQLDWSGEAGGYFLQAFPGVANESWVELLDSSRRGSVSRFVRAKHVYTNATSHQICSGDYYLVREEKRGEEREKF